MGRADVTAPLNNLDTRWRRMVSFTPAELPLVSNA